MRKKHIWLLAGRKTHSKFFINYTFNYVDIPHTTHHAVNIANQWKMYETRNGIQFIFCVSLPVYIIKVYRAKIEIRKYTSLVASMTVDLFMIPVPSYV